MVDYKKFILVNTPKTFAKMVEGDYTMQNGATGCPTAVADEGHSLEYLRLLMKRECEMDELKSEIGRLRMELAEEQGEKKTLKEENKQLRQEVARLKEALETRGRRGASTTPIVPLTRSADEDDEAVQRHQVQTRRKPKHIDPDTVARLKNDRKAFPVVCPKALEYWQRLMDEDLIDERLRPTARCGVTVAARIVSRMQTEVDPKITWAFFEKHWKISHLQSNLKRESYKDSKLYAVVNRIFGVAADAPYIAKSNVAV